MTTAKALENRIHRMERASAELERHAIRLGLQDGTSGENLSWRRSHLREAAREYANAVRAVQKG